MVRFTLESEASSIARNVRPRKGVPMIDRVRSMWLASMRPADVSCAESGRGLE